MQWMKKIIASLPVVFLKEKRAFIAYSPALDLSTAGKTVNEAKQRFKEAAELFFEECHNMGTLNEVLKELGWEKKRSGWIPPVTIATDSQTLKIPLPV